MLPLYIIVIKPIRLETKGTRAIVNAINNVVTGKTAINKLILVIFFYMFSPNWLELENQLCLDAQR